MSGAIINDVPKFQAPNPSVHTHAIRVNSDDDSHTLLIPLSLKGVTSYFNVRKPTTAERDDYQKYTRYELMSEEPKWDPSTDEYQKLRKEWLITKEKL